MAHKITWDDKVGIVPREVRINQVQDRDMNEVKLAVNDNADLLIVVEGETDVNTLDIIDLQDEKAEKNNIVNKSSDYTAVISDYILVSASIIDITIMLPTAIGVGGKEINITKSDGTSFNVIINTIVFIITLNDVPSDLVMFISLPPTPIAVGNIIVISIILALTKI